MAGRSPHLRSATGLVASCSGIPSCGKIPGFHVFMVWRAWIKVKCDADTKAVGSAGSDQSTNPLTARHCRVGDPCGGVVDATPYPRWLLFYDIFYDTSEGKSRKIVFFCRKNSLLIL